MSPSMLKFWMYQKITKTIVETKVDELIPIGENNVRLIRPSNKKPATKEVGCRLLLAINVGLFRPNDVAIQL